MWVVYTIICYFVLALLLPIGWASLRTWRRARTPLTVSCPAIGASALIAIDPGYAVKMHALGNYEYRVKTCSRWPGERGCGQQCLGQIATAAA